MSLTDIFIVYLTLGAPVAVSHFFECHNDTRLRQWLHSGGVLLLWPLKAFQMLGRPRSRAAIDTNFGCASDLDAAIERKTAEIIASIRLAALESNAVYEMRDIFDRYAAMMSGASSANNAAELLRIAGRGGIEIGSNCLNRRNAARLARHQNDARRALLSAVEHAAQTGSFLPEVVEKAAGLAALLGDAETEISLRRILNTQNYWTKPEGESWTSEPKPTLTEVSPIRFSTATAASKTD